MVNITHDNAIKMFCPGTDISVTAIILTLEFGDSGSHCYLGHCQLVATPVCLASASGTARASQASYGLLVGGSDSRPVEFLFLGSCGPYDSVKQILCSATWRMQWGLLDWQLQERAEPGVTEHLECTQTHLGQGGEGGNSFSETWQGHVACHTVKRTGLTQKPYWSTSKASNCAFDQDLTALRMSKAGKWCRQQKGIKTRHPGGKLGVFFGISLQI